MNNGIIHFSQYFDLLFRSIFFTPAAARKDNQGKDQTNIKS